MGKRNSGACVCCLVVLLGQSTGCVPQAQVDLPENGYVVEEAQIEDVVVEQGNQIGHETGPFVEQVQMEPLPLKPPCPTEARLPAGSVKSRSQTLAVSGTKVTVQVVEAPLGSVRTQVGLARGVVGATEALEAIASRHGAIAAINGSFFDAYSSRAVRNPYGTLITKGKVVHISDHPTVLAAWPNGRVAIGWARLRIVGGLDGNYTFPDNWYAYGINDYPQGLNWAELYTPDWASQTAPAGGVAIQVRRGIVAQKHTGSVNIPPDGYVLYLRGRETYLVERFRIGRLCSYRIELESGDGQHWLSAREVLGCGPLLVKNGQVVVDPPREGFDDPKVLTLACARSAVGLTPDGRLLLVTCRQATIARLAAAMKALGCVDAMNLDGGASSGLWFRGSYLTTPGRPISNALLLLPK
ncbi:MAG: phosphodiester glycosidase family protein [Candidatus Methanomethyliaceae archaeon]